MSASPNSAFLERWSSLEPFIYEEVATLEQGSAILVDRGHHSPTSSLTPQGSVSSDATAINTPQSASTSSSGLQHAGIDSIGQREPAGHEQQECYSEHSQNDYNVFTASPEIASANDGRAGVDDLLPDLALGNLDTQLAGASSTTAHSEHEFSGLLSTGLLQWNNSEAPLSQLSCFMDDANASCPPHLLRSEPERQQYQHSTSQAPAHSWEQFGGVLAYEQTRNHYADDFSSNRWLTNMSNDLFQYPSQLSAPPSFHIPDESQLSIGTSLNIELGYNAVNEKEMIPKNPSPPSSTQDSVISAFEDVQPQPESARHPLLVGGLSGPIRTKANSQNSQRGSHKNSSEFGLFAQRQRPKPRGAFTDPLERLETGETRKRGACIRCRMQRIRCFPDPNDADKPCVTCQGISNPTQSKLPCLRYKISEAALFDKDSHPQFRWCRRWREMKIVEIKEWETSEVKTVELTQDVRGASYKVNVRKFTPIEGDCLERRWKTNGKLQSYKCSSYAIVNMKETGQQLMKFVENNVKSSIEHFIGESDELLRCTYDMTFEYSEKAEASTSKRHLSNKLTKVNEQRDKERLLLRSLLKLWVAIRMESRSERICSEERLGMEPQIFDPAARNYNQVLIPPVMSAQLELVMTSMILQPLKKQVLNQLQDLIKADRPKSWFTIYLCLFILLHSCALLTSFENTQAKKYGLQSRYVYNSFVEELHHGSKIMLAYFHYCNKGSLPFAMDWTIERNIKQGELNPDQIQFLTKTTQLVQERSTLFDHITKTGEFEHNFFFLSQLYNAPSF